MDKKSLVPLTVITCVLILGMYVYDRLPKEDAMPRKKETPTVQELTRVPMTPIPLPLQYVQEPNTGDCYVVFPGTADTQPAKKPIPCDTIPKTAQVLDRFPPGTISAD